MINHLIHERFEFFLIVEFIIKILLYPFLHLPVRCSFFLQMKISAEGTRGIDSDRSTLDGALSGSRGNRARPSRPQSMVTR